MENWISGPREPRCRCVIADGVYNDDCPIHGGYRCEDCGLMGLDENEVIFYEEYPYCKDCALIMKKKENLIFCDFCGNLFKRDDLFTEDNKIYSCKNCT